MTRKKLILSIAAGAILLGAAAMVWKSTASTTRIGFVNYQPITLGEIGRANGNSFIMLEQLEADRLDKAGGYDMIFVNGMGLRLTEEERELLKQAAEKGVPVLATAATNPDNLIVSTDSVDSEFLKQYLAGGGRENYRSMLNYVRKFINGKRFFIGEIGDPQAAPSGVVYHTENARSDAPVIILTGQMGVADDLIGELEKRGNAVYYISNFQQALASGMADSIGASAVINMAHGRMGDAVVDYLTRNNIPLFAPLNVNRDYTEWMNDKMGMNGGFMSQSIVTPEIDGAIRPWALFAQYDGNDGVPEIKAIPGRLAEFVETVNNYTSLQSKPNREKKLAVFYFKGPGQNSLVAEGMEVGPSLYNLLRRLKAEGYRIDNLPASAAEFEQMINEPGSHAIGEKDYRRWAETALGAEMPAEVEAVDGAFPGHAVQTADGELALARLEFGNVVLIPQTAAGLGDDDFKIVHGTDMAPPHAYVASYLWARYGFGADAIMHFGAHGSLEFTPRKQVALGSRDWADRLIGTLPHIYVYSTSNVGEAMMAKRRSYAAIVNYLTPPFIESNVRGIYKQLSDAIAAYNNEETERAALKVKQLAVELGVHRELRLDSCQSMPYSAAEIARIESFAEELANEKINGAHYVMGQPYNAGQIESTTYAMTVDPIAYSLFALDKLRGAARGEYTGKGVAFTRKYITPARALVKSMLASKRLPSDAEICRIAGITEGELSEARAITQELNGSKDLFSKMLVMASSMPAEQPTAKLAERTGSPSAKMKKMMNATGMSPEKAIEMARKMGADSAAIAKMSAAMKRGKASGKPAAHGTPMMSAPKYSTDEIEKANAIMEIERALTNVSVYSQALAQSPESELASIVNALNGGYTAPTSGGDPVMNPRVLPTGRNMFAVNAEETPSASAWEKGKALVDNTLKMYGEAHGDSLPRKVSYTLWSSEFIETEGATIAQVLYMLGVEPVRDPFGRVTDLRLIDSKELGRPRIDVVVQTSGQLRDLAASRLFLISRAVEMAAGAQAGDVYPNYVAEGVLESERHLVERGVSPKEAREMSTARVFGGVNGNYGSGIQEMVEAGDRWDDRDQIAETYIHNMGASYGSEKDWEKLRDYAFEAALTRTDVVVQPRQSNTWGALSLDHVYEFMGGMNLAAKYVTGKEPDAYLADYRNRNRNRMQELKEAIGVESRTTILNPTYIREKMKGGAGDASAIADVVRNTYGWNVMKEDVIDDELWNDIYNTYINDIHNLGTREYFTSVNPQALEEITAVMLETARKGMWNASAEQLAELTRLHTEVVSEGPANDGLVMQKNQLNPAGESTTYVSGGVIAALVLVCLIVVFTVIKRRRKNEL